MFKAALTTGSALLAQIGRTPGSLSTAGRRVHDALKTHGAAVGTAATVASLVPAGGRKAVARSAASGAEAQTYLARYRATNR